MSEAATPAAQDNGTPPVVPAATPAQAAAQAPAAATPETVTLTKEAHDQLARDAARASTNQRKADLWDRTNGGKGNSGHFRPTTPAAQPSEEEKANAASEEDRKAERGLMALVVDPSYRDLLDADPTLREMLVKNPLAVLPILAPDALDAEDAVSLVREALNKRRPAQTTPPAAAPAATPAANTPPVGAVNAQSVIVNEQVEAARKNPNTENAIAGMIGAKLKGGNQ